MKENDKDGMDNSSSIDDRILSHQLGLVTKDPIKDKAWEREQQRKTIQEQVPNADTKTMVQDTWYFNDEMQTLKIWFDTKPFTKELEDRIRELPKIVFSDDAKESYIRKRKKKPDFYNSLKEEMTMALSK